MINWRLKLARFKAFLGPEVWRLFLLATIIGFVWFLIESGFVVILQAFLTSIGLIEKSKTILPEWFSTEIITTSFILIIFGIIRGYVTSIKYFLAVSTGQSFIRFQKSQILELGLSNAQNMSTSEVMISFSEHTNTASIALSQMTILINNFVSIIFFVVAGFYLAPREFLLSGLLLAIVLIPIKFLNKKISGIDLIIHREKELVNKILVDGLKNNFLLQIYHLLDLEIKKGNESLSKYEQAYKKYGRIAGIRTALPQTAGAIVIAIVTYLSLNYFHTPGSKLLSFFYIFIRMAQCSSEFYSVSGDMKIQLVGLKTLYFWNEKLKDLKRIQKPQNSLVKVNLEKIDIDINSLSFKYGEKEVIKNLDIHLKASDILLIKGESGAGKSTLLSLIIGLLAPSSGTVLINDNDPINIREELSKKIGYVGPEPYMVSGSVKENLLYGHPNISSVSDDLIWWALEKAHLKEEIKNLPKMLDENLLERTQFSTGQKQRMAIARAVLRMPSILILDEATANLDADTESKFISLLLELTSDMTTIIVSHKDAFNKIATSQIKLDKVI